jgi:hypothetical protein
MFITVLTKKPSSMPICSQLNPVLGVVGREWLRGQNKERHVETMFVRLSPALDLVSVTQPFGEFS